MDTIIAMSEKVKWIWVDCFTKLPINKEIYSKLRSFNFKLCLVSPDLQGQENRIEEYRDFLIENKLIMDAVCVKSNNVSRW